MSLKTIFAFGLFGLVIIGLLVVGGIWAWFTFIRPIPTHDLLIAEIYVKTVNPQNQTIPAYVILANSSGNVIKEVTSIDGYIFLGYYAISEYYRIDATNDLLGVSGTKTILTQNGRNEVVIICY